MASSDTLTLLYTMNEWLFSPCRDDSRKFVVFLPLVVPVTGPAGYPAVEAAEEAGCRWHTGALAESWEHSDDYRTWTFHLHPDATLHDAPLWYADRLWLEEETRVERGSGRR